MMGIRKGTVFYGHQAGLEPGNDFYEDILIGKNEEVHL
jgi:hypothetical protein